MRKIVEITILGSGGFIPTKKQASSGYLLKIQNEYLLLDCGAGVISRLLDINFKWQKINNIFISHTHIDHINDLFTIIHSQVANRKKPLNIYGPKNILKLGIFIRNELTGLCRPPQFLFHDITSRKKSINNFAVHTLLVKHHKIIPALSYKFITGNKILVYSGDLGPMTDKDQFIKFCRKTDLLIADSGGQPAKPGGDHLNPEQIGELAQKAGVKKLVLTHQLVKSMGAIITNCRKTYSGEIVAAQDLMKIKV